MKELPLCNINQSKLLKEKGFDWPTDECMTPEWNSNAPVDYNGLGMVSRPTIALALRWLEQTKGLHLLVDRSEETGNWGYAIRNWDIIESEPTWDFNFWTENKDEVESIGLDKLLEIV